MAGDSQPVRCRISLRGSLASTYHQILLGQGMVDGDRYIESLLSSSDPNLEKRANGGQIVMGLKTDRGLFPPDW